MITTIISLLAAAPLYNSWYSPKIADTIMQDAAKHEYHAYLDYNGDGTEDVLDAISVLKRYYSNIENGNTITFDKDVMDRIAEENGIDYIYYEIDFIDDEATREYEYTADKVERIHIYYETEDIADGFYVVLNPFEETISVE